MVVLNESRRIVTNLQSYFRWSGRELLSGIYHLDSTRQDRKMHMGLDCALQFDLITGSDWLEVLIQGIFPPP